LLHEAKFNKTFIHGVEILRKGFDFDISKGSDIVEGSYQHLPVFFRFLKIKGSEMYNDHVIKITMMVLQRRITRANGLFSEMQQLLPRLYKIKSKGKYPLEEKLIKTLLYLILPVSSPDELLTPDQKKANDLEAHHWLSKIESVSDDMGELYSEFLYIRCWVARRVGLVAEAKQVALKGIALFENDPRFYHGLMLADYCTFLDTKINERTIADIDAMLDSAEKAYQRYIPFIDKYYHNPYKDEIVAKLNDCFNNNFCYLFTEKAKILYHKKAIAASIPFIEHALASLDKMRPGKDFRERLSEYYDTAANLYYLQSYYTDLYNPQERLSEALSSINNALLLTTRRDIMSEYEKEKEKIKRRQEDTRKTSRS